MSEPRFWVVRVSKGQEVIEAVKSKGVVAVGFNIEQSVAKVEDREKMKEIYRSACPSAREGRVITSVGQLYRIAHVIKEGDWILTPDRDRRVVLFGQVKGSYQFIPNAIDEEHYHAHARKVDWKGEFSRDDMSTPLRNSMGGSTTILNMDKHSAELLRLFKGEKSNGGDGSEDNGEGISFYEETKTKADEQIGDLIAAIDPYDFQTLVAGLLQAMGYRTRVSERGPDQGVDIIAHPDALGFERPRIKVQVKHRTSAAGGPEIRNLVGTLGEQETGLFVSTGGFTKEALAEARRNVRPLTLLDADQFVDLLTEYYDELDAAYKALVPLRNVWVPAHSK